MLQRQHFIIAPERRTQIEMHTLHTADGLDGILQQQ